MSRRKAHRSTDKRRATNQGAAWLANPERTTCPTPAKIAYPNRKEAKSALRAQAGAGRRGTHNGRLSAYRCVCKRFHVGSMPAARKEGSWVYAE